jgi:hypothetical protein
LTVGTLPVRFVLARGFHAKPSVHVLSLVFRETSGACEPPPQFAGYVLFWEPHRLTVTLLLRPPSPPHSNVPCILVAHSKQVDERVTLRRALGARKLFDGSTSPPTPVRPG